MRRDSTPDRRQQTLGHTGRNEFWEKGGTDNQPVKSYLHKKPVVNRNGSDKGFCSFEFAFLRRSSRKKATIFIKKFNENRGDRRRMNLRSGCCSVVAFTDGTRYTREMLNMERNRFLHEYVDFLYLAVDKAALQSLSPSFQSSHESEAKTGIGNSAEPCRSYVFGRRWDD